MVDPSAGAATFPARCDRPCGRPRRCRGGNLLSLVNQGNALFTARLTSGLQAKVAVNYAPPFVVASVGFLAAGRADDD